MSTNIDDLLQKQNNPEQVSRTADVPDSQKLNAQEFIRMVSAIKENQNSAKAVRMDGVTHHPNENGVVTLPNPSSIQGDVYTSRIEVAASFNTTNPRVVKERVLQIPIKFMAILTSGGERLNAGIGGTLHIERSANNFSTASEVGSLFMQSRDADASSYDTIDIGQYLQEGEQQFRFYATYQYIDENGETKVATSPYTSLATVTLTNMQLVFSGNWQRPFSGGSIDAGYFVSGYGQMLLYVEVDGTRVVNGRQVTTSTETAVKVSITTASLITNGLHTIRAWLASAIDTNVTSDVQESQVLYFDESTATTIEKQTAYVMISNVAQNVTPYVETHLFDYAVYKYGAETVQLEIIFTNSTNTATYLSHDLGNVAVGGESHNEYNNALQIPTGVTTAYMRLNVNGSIQQGRYWSLAIDQSINFSPTTIDANGFIFDASSRSNEEDHPERVINARNGEVVAAQWSSGMKFSPSSGYIETEGDVKHLHIPAGEWLKITGYDPMVFTDSMTMEFDVKISNVYDENVPVIRVGRETINGILGFEMLPLTAYLMTEQQHARGSQDIQIGEDERTHIAVNIIRNLGGRGVNFVRLFVNGIINREFIYGDDDSFVSQSGSGGIQIGSTKAEVDVYSIRVYKTSLSSNNIRQDYLSTIPTASDKVAFYRTNNILGGDNTISYDLTKQLYSTMLWIPDDTSKAYLPSYRTGANVSFSKGTLKVIFRYRYNTNGHQKGEINYDLSRIYTHMKIKGQGTSSMTYWTWNLRFQFSDESEVWSMTPSLEKKAVLLSNVGKVKDEWECYGIFEEGGAHATKLDAKANWASSSQSHKMGMMNSYGDLWKQIIGVRNPIYDYDRKTRPCILQEAFMFFVQDANGNASIANLGEDSSFIRFSNFMTFGPAKNDKATWGTGVKSSHYIKNGAQKSMYTCLEGSSNGRPLAEAKIPWITEEVFYYFNTADDEDPMNETFIYNGDSQFDFDKGPSDEHTYGANKTYDVPKGFTQVPNTVMWQETTDMNYNSSDIYLCNGNTVKFYRRAFNFAYLNTHHLEVVEGDYNDFMDMADEGLLDNNKQYFVMNDGGGHSKGDCFRYNPLSEKNPSLPKWVNAGITKNQLTDDGYAVLNLLTDLSDYMPSSYNPNNAISLRDAFITARLTRYRGNGTSTGSSLYWDEVECDLCQAWGKVMAAKDNWCKNTYLVLRPDGKLTMYRDDDDTILDKDNVGKTGTPYQVEEHDRYNDDGVWADENGKGEIWDKTTGEYNDVTNPRNTYWNSQDSVLFTIREQTRGGYRSDMGDEMRRMVGTIFQTMMLQQGSVDAFFQKHFFDIQEYFPAVAYNEVARLLYEEAKIHMDANVYSGRELYTNNTDPITQSLGDQLQGEKQWIKRRIPYMESFGQSSIFADSHGAGALSFRSSLASTDLGSTHSYVFRVTPHQFLYPAAGSESSTVFSSNRTRPSEEVALPTLTVTQNNNVFIYGINYLRSVGDFAPHPTEPNSSIGVVGERLEEWIINEDGSQTVENRSASISLSTPRLQRLVMRNCTSLNSLGSSSLRNLSRLVSADLRGCTSLSAIVPPATPSVETLYLPSNMTGFSISNTPNLSTLYFEGFGYLTSMVIGSNVGNINIQSLLTGLYNAKSIETDPLKMMNTLDVRDIQLRNMSTDFMLWLTRIENIQISGYIYMSQGASLPFESKRTLLNKFGNIDDPNNTLYVTYSVSAAGGLTITAPFAIRQAGRYKVLLRTSNANANDFIKTEVVISLNNLGITYDEETEELVVPAISETPYYITITGNYYNDASDPTHIGLTVEENLAIYDRPAQVGDLVYADGDFGDKYIRTKPLIGLCFYVNPNDPKDRRMIAADGRIEKMFLGSVQGGWFWGVPYASPMNNMSLVDSPRYSVYDTPIPNFAESETSIAGAPKDPDYSNYEDAGEQDGFKKFAESHVLGQLDRQEELEENMLDYPAGTKMPWGKYTTLLGLIHRNKILSDSGVNKPIPTKTLSNTEMEVLLNYMAAVYNERKNAGDSGNDAYIRSSIYYPAFSLCYAYEPSVEKNTLADKFKAHNWYLPSASELSRYAYYAWKVVDGMSSPFSKFFSEVKPISNKFISTKSVNMSITTSDEEGASANWFIRYWWNNRAIDPATNGKATPRCVIPVCQF